jgi:hypothetical protein
MKPPKSPRIDTRRTREFSDELQERARTWIPKWAFADVEGDFGRALLEIAARFSSEVAERLDGGGEKLRRGFLDWLGVQGEAARPARMPVVFKLADAAQEPVFASPPVRMRVEADGTSVVFEAETETDLRLVPGRLDIIVGVDADKDAIYFPPPGLSDLKPFEQLPTQWQLKSFASAGAIKLQLEPAAGFSKGMTIEAGGRHYRIDEIDNGIVTIDPPLEADLEISEVRKVETFAPFDGITRDRQEHALYIGHNDLLNIEAAAAIDVIGAGVLVDGVKWQYWGKSEKSDEPGWQNLEIVENPKSDALFLKKRIGAVEPRKIGEINSRWIRAVTKKLDNPSNHFTADALKLRINCEATPPPCPSPDSTGPGVTGEAMANNTPLVLSEPFFPLGRVPQQFDAFYLGSTEAFSKTGATARVCFEMSDATCRAYTPVRTGSFANEGTLAGVGEDRALHLFKMNPATGTMTRFRGPLRPPLPAGGSAAGPPPQNTPVELNPRCVPAVWNGDPANGDDFFVAVAAMGNIWIWHENAADRKKSGWTYHSRVPDRPGRPAQIESILVLKSSPTRPGTVLSDGRLWVFNGTEWSEPSRQTPPPVVPLRDYAVIAPVLDPAFDITDSVVAVSVLKDLYSIDIDPLNLTEVTENAIPLTVDLDVGQVETGMIIPVGGIQPAAVQGAGADPLQVVAVDDTRENLVAIEAGSPPEQLGSFTAGLKALGARVAVWNIAGKLQFSVSAESGLDAVFLASWVPTFVSTDPAAIFYSRIVGAIGVVGSPLTVGANVVVPGSRSDAFVAPLNLLGRLEFLGPNRKLMQEGVVVPQPEPFQVGDIVSALTKPGNQRKEWVINTAAARRGTTSAIYLVDPSVGASLANNPQLLGYAGPGLAGTAFDATKFDPTAADPAILPNTFLRIKVSGQPVDFFEVDNVDAVSGQVTVKTPLPGNPGDPLSYRRPKSSPAAVVPAMEFDPSGDGNWDVSILSTARLYFDPTLTPSTQKGSAFGIVGNHPTVVALGQRWTSVPDPVNTLTAFVIDGVVGAWRQQLADTASNPALSWEYWNGKGWWSLEIIEDATARLANSGVVRFKVPDDIAESDWAGKTNFWIRVRLVGGDYGKEEVSFITRPIPDSDDTEQIVKRSTDNIKAPQVLSLRISYSICTEQLPKYVLAEDSGSIVDQSDANRTGGAIVEAFVPVGLMLGRLSSAAAPTEEAHECLPDCDCQKQGSSENNGPAALAASPPVPVIPKGGRSLFIGLDAIISAGPVSVLLMVDKENDHLAFAPMTIEALVAGQFKPIVADDATRALGESGVLLMSFAVPPKLSNLFGRPRTWLRLTPKTMGENWVPSIRGAYLNAVFASSKETLTRELIGSSDGSQNLTLRLARPPVLRDTLELRVREPLGEEERVELAAADPDLVLTDPDGLRGYWVRWKKVTDPDDEAASERIYALDETNGEIRFGDGMHGRIPPIGRNNIVAFSYSRTEAGPPGSDVVPANSVKARTSLNLVSPVESVESVTAADQAAGGAPPESDDRVLRYGYARFRHRGRAVTARDIEDLALQSSPDIAQARAVAGPGRIRLVVVMKGKRPKPSAAQARELSRFLLEASPVSLAAPGALRIEGPGIRRLRVDLVLKIERLDYAAQVSKWVNTELEQFFDRGLGGFDRDGWPLGLNPSEDDIAFALSDAPLLDGIRDIKRFEIPADGRESVWPASIKPTEIIVLDDDPVRIRFETAEVTG